MLLRWLQITFLFTESMTNGSSVGGGEVYTFQTPKRSNKMAELGTFSSFFFHLALAMIILSITVNVVCIFFSFKLCVCSIPVAFIQL